jgi:ATP-dependent DNA helicase RecQ
MASPQRYCCCVEPKTPGWAGPGRAGLTRVSTFGILKERPEVWLLSLLRRCVTAGWVDFVGQDRPVAILTERGAAVMKATAPARIILPQVAVQASPRRSR